MATRIQVRRGTAAQWAASNPVLTAGEPAYETDTGLSKWGDGTTAYNDLPYYGPRRADVLDKASTTTALTGISAVTAWTALDLSATVDGIQAIVVKAKCPVTAVSAVGTRGRLLVYDGGTGGTLLNLADGPTGATSALATGAITVETDPIVPTAGVHNYTIAAQGIGGGTVNFSPGAGFPAWSKIVPADT